MASKSHTLFDPVAASSLDGDAELLRLLRFTRLGWTPPPGGAVFACRPAADFRSEWNRWLEGPVAERLGAAVLAVHQRGLGVQAREIVDEDRAVDSSLDVDEARRSREAGCLLLGALVSAKRVRLAERVALLLNGGDAGKTGPHLATAVALQAVVFHLPPQIALLGYVFAEWRASHLGLGLPTSRSEAGRFLDEVPQAWAWARRLLRGTDQRSPRAIFG